MSAVYEEIKTAHGSLRFLIVYGISMLLIMVLAKDRRKQFIIPAVFMTVIVLNPVFYKLWAKLNEAMVYWRTLWILPIVPVCAAAVAIIADRMKPAFLKAGAVIIGIIVFCYCGNFIYDYPLNMFQTVFNADKLPDDVVHVADALLKIDQEPYAVFDSELSVYMRQYSGRIMSPYARSVTYGVPGQLGGEMYDLLENGLFKELSQRMVNNDYKYLVTENETEGKKMKLKKSGFKQLEQIGRYGIYRVFRDRTEIRKYNALHQVTSLTYLDEKGKPVNCDLGFASVFYDYDDYGRVSYEFHRNEEGKGAPDNEGKAGWRRKYNRLSQILSETNLGPDEEPVVVNYASIKSKYNYLYRLVKEEYYDESGKPMLRTDTLYASKELDYNRTGQLLSEKYYGLSHEPVINHEGFAEIEFIRDEEGNVIEERTYDEDHHLAKRIQGYSIIKRKYDKDNRLVSEAYYNSDGSKVNNDMGCHRIKYEYDEDGSPSLNWYYDKNGNRLPCGSSYLHEFLKSLNRQNLVIFLSVKDEGTGALTQTLQDDLNALGIRTDLLNKYRYSYYAVITPKDVIEDLSNTETLHHSGRLDKKHYTIISGGYSAGNISSIKIDGTEYSNNARGLNIVVYDRKKKKVTEHKTFDTCVPEMQVTE